MDEVLAAKYGMSPEQVRLGHQRLTELGQEVGMVFDFERVQLGSTFDAHRLAVAVRGTDAEDGLVKNLFAAYFTEGKLLSDPEVLVEAAAAAGIDPDVARAVVEGGEWADEVRHDEATARELGITGVPHFVINGQWAVPGAQDVPTLVTVLRRAWERTEVQVP